MGFLKCAYTPVLRENSGLAIASSEFVFKSSVSGYANAEVINMSYVNPKLRTQFESLSVDLKNEILSRDVSINNLHDLIAVLEDIVNEADSAP